jgi:hypothetical protein
MYLAVAFGLDSVKTDLIRMDQWSKGPLGLAFVGEALVKDIPSNVDLGLSWNTVMTPKPCA